VSSFFATLHSSDDATLQYSLVDVLNDEGTIPLILYLAMPNFTRSIFISDAGRHRIIRTENEKLELDTYTVATIFV